MSNIYFELTEELNAEGSIVVLTSGQAVVYYRISMMSKDGDWILRETPEACQRVLAVLGRHGARYRPGAPLDVRWLLAAGRATSSSRTRSSAGSDATSSLVHPE